MSNSNINEKELEKIIDEKVEERTKDLKNQVEELRDELKDKEKSKENSSSRENGNLSRRDFLKKAGTGAIGLSALALLPSTSAFNIKTSNPLQYFNSSRDTNPNFKVSSSGDITGNTADLDKLIAKRVEATQKFLLPDQTSSENKEMWIEEVDSETSELKVRLKGNTKTIVSETVISIPNSAIHRWKYDEGSGSTVADNIGSADGAITGATWESGTYIGSNALSSDGQDDYVNTSSLGSFGSSLGSGWAIAFTFESTSMDAEFILGRNNGGGQTRMVVHSGSWSSSQGSLGLTLQDDNGNTDVATTNSTFNDGSKHRLVINVPDSSASNFEFYVDNSSKATTVQSSEGASSFSDFSGPVYIHVENDSGSLNNPHKGKLDDVIIFDSTLSSQEIQDDYDRQPWS